MTILESLKSTKTDFIPEKNTVDKQNFSDNATKDAFSRVFDSANKSYNETYENKISSFTEQDLNSYNKNTYNQQYNSFSNDNASYTSQNNEYRQESSSLHKQKDSFNENISNNVDNQKDLINDNIKKSSNNDVSVENKSKNLENKTHETNSETKTESITVNKETEKSEIQSTNKSKNNQKPDNISNQENLEISMKMQLASTVNIAAQQQITTNSKKEAEKNSQEGDKKAQKQAVSAQQIIIQDKITPQEIQKQAVANDSSQITKEKPFDQIVQKAVSSENSSKKAVKEDSSKDVSLDAKVSGDLKTKTNENSKEVSEKALEKAKNILEQAEIKKEQIEIKVKSIESQNNSSIEQQNQPNTEIKKTIDKPATKLEKDEIVKPIAMNNEQADIKKESYTGQEHKRHNLNENGINIQALANSNSNSAIKAGFDKSIQFENIFESKLTQNPMAESVLNQVKEKISTDLTSNATRLSIALRPENLGKIEIELVSSKGSLTAQITAENSQVKDILNQTVENLKQSLQDQGVQVNKIVVTVQEQPKDNNQQQSSQFDAHKFDQFNQNSQNPQSNSSNYANSTNMNYSETTTLEIENEENPAINSNLSTNQAGKVDYRI